MEARKIARKDEDFDEPTGYAKRRIEQRRLENLLGSEVYGYVFNQRGINQLSEDLSGLGYSKEVISKYFVRLQDRFQKGLVGKRTYFALNDLITHPYLSKLTDIDSKEAKPVIVGATRLLENLMGLEFRGLRKLDDIRQYDSSERTWRGMDRLGLEYFEEIQQGYGLPGEEKLAVSNRSHRQQRIANKILIRALPYIARVVDNFLASGKTFNPKKRRMKIDEDEEEKVVGVRGQFLDASKIELGDRQELRQDLISYASQKLIEYMHNYQPEVAAISGFIKRVTKTAIIRYVEERVPLVRVPAHIAGGVRKAISESDSRNK